MNPARGGADIGYGPAVTDGPLASYVAVSISLLPDALVGVLPGAGASPVATAGAAAVPAILSLALAPVLDTTSTRLSLAFIATSGPAPSDAALGSDITVGFAAGFISSPIAVSPSFFSFPPSFNS